MSSGDSAPIPKRIIICCDGTWQDAASGLQNTPSNITRLARCINRVGQGDGKTWQQIVWYDSGIGTEANSVTNTLEGLLGAAAGMEKNIIEAYSFVTLNYSPGDKIFCFGFSRGAYTARSIAGLITDIGICEPGKLQDFYQIWQAYKQNQSYHAFSSSDLYYDYVDGVSTVVDGKVAWKSPAHGEWATTPESKEVEVVGVYDTVGALGLPDFHGLKWGPNKFGYHNVKLNPNIKYAFQALGLDDHREAYIPTLWHLPKEKKNLTEAERAAGKAKKVAKLAEQEKQVERTKAAYLATVDDVKLTKDQRTQFKKDYNQARRDLNTIKEDLRSPSKLLQVWFPGYHVNIGGGSTNKNGDLEEMSNITFSWMLQQIRPYLSINEATVRQEAVSRQRLLDEVNKKVDEFYKQKAKDEEAAKKSWVKWAGAVFSDITHGEEPNPQRREPGWGTGILIDSYGTMDKVLNGSKFRTPGGYEKDPKYTAPGDTNEHIHPTTGYRYTMFKDKAEKLHYHPAGVTEKLGYKREPRTDGQKGWQYVLRDGVILPEYRIQSAPEGQGTNFERWAFSQVPTAVEYLKVLDKDNGFTS